MPVGIQHIIVRIPKLNISAVKLEISLRIKYWETRYGKKNSLMTPIASKTTIIRFKFFILIEYEFDYE